MQRVLEVDNVVSALLLKIIVCEGELGIKRRGEELGLLLGGTRRVYVIMLLCGRIQGYAKCRGQS